MEKKKDNSEYEIDRELTGKFAIEKNAEYQDRIAELEEENKTLKDNVEFLHSCLDDRDKSIAIMQEENKKLKEEIENHKQNIMQDELEIIPKLEEENKKLKEVNKKLGEWVDKLTKDTFGVAEENKKLNIKVASLEGEIKGLNSVIDKLKEENQTLELWLDRKEKLNKGYREDVDYWHHRCMVAERGGEDEE